MEGSNTTGNTIQGNYIGTNAAGTVALPNFMGLEITGGGQTNTVGGAPPG